LKEPLSRSGVGVPCHNYASNLQETFHTVTWCFDRPKCEV
jgi:hypothetical protein